jgi:tetratricopeptide (TPR) repeat protein
MIPCPVCEANDPWKNVDEYRTKPVGMSLCQSCGFITYPQIVAEQQKMKEYYREEYRDVPSVQNVYAGQRKLHYHHAFLEDLLSEWKSSGKKPRVFEIGAAFGMALNWLKQQFPEGDFRGAELTRSYRRNAWHEYGIYLGEEFEDDQKTGYDLVMTYKVAEHIPNPVKELRRYALSLKPGSGRLYISVPIWFKELSNFGTSGFSLEYYYHKNHINVWTEGLFLECLRRAGLRVVKENHTYYGDTYLCVRDDEEISKPAFREDPARILTQLELVKAASIAWDEARFDHACAHWANFPEAQTARYESNRAQYHKQGFEAIWSNLVKPALEACPDSPQVRLFAADLCMRYDRWEQALEHLEKGLEMRPNDPPALMHTATCFQHMAQQTPAGVKEQLFARAREAYRHLRATSLQSQPEAMTWIFNMNARLPMPEARPQTLTPDGRNP